MSADSNFQLQKDRIPVLFIEPLSGSLEKLCEQLSQNEELQIVRCVSTLQAIPVLRQAGGGLLLMTVADRNSVVKQVSLLKMLTRLLRRGTVKVLVTSKIKHGGLFSLYQNHGVTELLEEPVHPRSLQIKADRYLNRMRSMFRKGKKDESDAEGGANRKRKAGKGGSKGPGPESKRSQDAKWKLGPPLELESDFWLAKGGSGRRVMGRWMVRLIGPSPTVGRWVEIEGETAGTNRFWQWTPNNPEDATFLKEEGAWVFYGHRPDFAEDRWVFVGSAPRLSFYYDSKSYGDKLISGEDGTLIIAADSKHAQNMLDAIIRTFERVIRAEQRKELEGDFRLEGEGALDLPPDEVVEDDAEAPIQWNGEVEGEQPLQADSPDFVDERDGEGGELNDLREEDESSPDWNDQRAEDDESAADWDDQRSDDDEEPEDWNDGREDDGETAPAKRRRRRAEEQSESPELHAEINEEQGTELEGSFSEDQPVSLRDRRRPDRAGGEAAEDDERDEAPGAPQLRDSDAREQHRMPASQFGDSGGAWDFVRELGDGDRWYVFVDAALSDGAVEDAASLSMFWLYEGSEPVDWDEATSEWLFWDRPPRVHGSFDGLPKPVQSYLRQLEVDEAERELLGALSGEDAAEDGAESEEESESREPGTPGTKGRRGNDEESQAEEDDDSDVKVVEIVRDPELKSKKKKSGDSNSEDLYERATEEESGAEEPEAASENGFASAMRKRIESLGDELPQGVSEALEAVEESIQKSGIGAALEISKGKKSRKAEEADLRGNPEHPGLSAMAMAFLLSELLGRVGMDPRWASERFCAYLSNALGGLTVELLGEDADRRASSPGSVSIAVEGGLATLRITGDGADSIPQDYLATLAHVLAGLARALAGAESMSAAA